MIANMQADAPLRLFFAVPVDDAVRAAARAAIEALRRCGADARWVDVDTMHLTLRFLGQTPASAVPALEKALAAAATGRPAFELAFDRLGSFKDRGLPKVIWAGVGDGGDRLADLAAALNGALKAEGFPEADREFKAHFTLGRLRSARGASFLRKALVEAKPLDWRLRVDRAVLFKSELAPSGPRHTELATSFLK